MSSKDQQNDALMGTLPDVVRDTTELTQFEQVESVTKLPFRNKIQHSLAQIDVQSHLTREYLIQELSLPYTGSGFDELANPLSVLVNAQPIYSILSRYAYFGFRALKVRFVVTSLPQQYGFIPLTRLPWWQTEAGNTPVWGPLASMGKDLILLPVTDQATVEIELPFLYPHPIYPLYAEMCAANSRTEGDFFGMWTLFLQMGYWGITDSSVNNTVTLAMYASFIDPVVSLPVTLIDPSLPTVRPKEEVEEFEAQSSFSETIGQYHATAAAFVSGAGVLANQFKEFYGTAQDAAKTVFDAKETWQKVTRLFQEDHEQRATVQQDAFGELSTGAISCGQRSLVYEPMRMLDPMYYGSKNNRHSIYEIMRNHPYPITFTKMISGQTITVYANPSFDYNTMYYPNYLQFFSQFFKWWKGSLEISFVIFTSPFISARVRVAMVGTGTDTPHTDVSDPVLGNLPCIVQTVKGQTIIPVEVPFVYPFARYPTYVSDEASSTLPSTRIAVTLSLEKIIGAGGLSPALYVAVFMRPGNDFRYEDPQSAQLPAYLSLEDEWDRAKQEATEEFTAQMNCQDWFRNVQTFPGMQPSPNDTWDTTVEDLMSRWSTRGIATDGTHSDVIVTKRTIDFSQPHGFLNNYDLLANLFVFNSGEISYKLATTAAADTNFYIVLPSFRGAETSSSDTLDPANGMAATNTAVMPVLDVDVPFRHIYDVDMNNSLVQPEIWSNAVWANVPVQSQPLQCQFVRPGPTFQMFHMLPPPERAYWAWASSDVKAKPWLKISRARQTWYGYKH